MHLAMEMKWRIVAIPLIQICMKVNVWGKRTFLTDRRTLPINKKALTLHHENIESDEKNFINFYDANSIFSKYLCYGLSRYCL